MKFGMINVGSSVLVRSAMPPTQGVPSVWKIYGTSMHAYSWETKPNVAPDQTGCEVNLTGLTTNADARSVCSNWPFCYTLWCMITLSCCSFQMVCLFSDLRTMLFFVLEIIVAFSHLSISSVFFRDVHVCLTLYCLH